MNWKRYGRIFSPENFGLAYAKSPQAIEFDEYIRVYFSDCKKDGSKLISYVCFADFTKDFKSVLRVERQIISDGALGAFDEHGIFPFSPVWIGDKLYAYTSGMSRRVSVSVDSGIGLAISLDNGETFQRIDEGPVLTSNLHEPFLVIDGFVRKYGDLFHMWYIYGENWKVFQEGAEPDRIYKIAHAVSKDGIEWMRGEGKIIEDKIEEESQALPTVVFYKNIYHMFFCYRCSYDFRTNSRRSYRLGYAKSYDLKKWVRCDEELQFPCAKSGWDSEMLCYPNAFVINGKLYMLYNGNGFGKSGFGLAELEEEE